MVKKLMPPGDTLASLMNVAPKKPETAPPGEPNVPILDILAAEFAKSHICFKV